MRKFRKRDNEEKEYVTRVTTKVRSALERLFVSYISEMTTWAFTLWIETTIKSKLQDQYYEVMRTYVHTLDLS
jgi:hypothetical protein